VGLVLVRTRSNQCAPGTLVRKASGAIAQLEERLVCIQKARGSSPLSSTGQRPHAILRPAKQSQTKSQSRRTIRHMTATARRGHGEGPVYRDAANGTVRCGPCAGGHSRAVRIGRVLSSGLATVLAIVTALAAAAVAVGDTVWEQRR
jgi:hypothetical protein